MAETERPAGTRDDRPSRQERNNGGVMGEISDIRSLPLSVQLQDTARTVFYLLLLALVIVAASMLDGLAAKIGMVVGACTGFAVHWRATCRSVMFIGPTIDQRTIAELISNKLSHVTVEAGRSYRPALPRALYFDTQVLELRPAGTGIELLGPKMVLRFVRRRLLGTRHEGH
jgi:hypothetical protein